jgi:hypothetical protein
VEKPDGCAAGLNIDLAFFVVAIETPGASDLAEELGQRLLARQIVKAGFHLTTYDSYSVLEFPNSSRDSMENIESDAADWLLWKHPALKKRRVTGKRQKQSLGLPVEAAEEFVCLEIRK